MARLQLTTPNYTHTMCIRRTSRQAIIQTNGDIYARETIIELSLPSIKAGLKQAWSIAREIILNAMLPMPAVA